MTLFQYLFPSDLTITFGITVRLTIPFIWRRLSVVANLRYHFSNCQWCGKFWRANHSEFLLRIDDQNFDKCHIPIQQNWTPTHLQHAKLSFRFGLFGQHIPHCLHVLYQDHHPHVHHSTIITIILNSPADASRRWGLLRVASLNCRSRGILGDLTDYSIGLLKGWGFWMINQLDSV